jgi:7-cyano-7-deazaguanine reductase
MVTMDSNPLGRKVTGSSTYDPGLLFPVAREESRRDLRLSSAEFTGYDRWNCHEVTWLNPDGMPVVSRLQLEYPSSSRAIVESKSLKLYLNSLAFEVYNGTDEVSSVIAGDIAKVTESKNITVRMLGSDQQQIEIVIDPNQLLERKSVTIVRYNYDPSLLVCSDDKPGLHVQATHLFRSNCPVTGQPDYATVVIRYKSPCRVTDESLLAYLVSFRNHSGYHESCCELILDDLVHTIEPEECSIHCYFTRRGGIDINPARFYNCDPDQEGDSRYFRQ